MKTLGLIGSISWESTVIYYRLINRRIRERAGRSLFPCQSLQDGTAEKIKGQGISHVGLLGTRYTMEQDFSKSRLINRKLWSQCYYVFQIRTSAMLCQGLGFSKALDAMGDTT
jgi:aspartate/glutamate racemase